MQMWLVRALACRVVPVCLSTTLRMKFCCVSCISHRSRPHLLSIQASVLDGPSCDTSTFDGAFLKHLSELLSGQWCESFYCRLNFTGTSRTTITLVLLCRVQWFNILTNEGELSGRVSVLYTSLLVSEVYCIVLLLILVCCRLGCLRARWRLVGINIADPPQNICLSKLLIVVVRVAGLLSWTRRGSCAWFHHSHIILHDQLIY